MIRKQQGDIVWFEFELLQAYSHIRHGCFARVGGLSQGPFSSLNVGFHPQENPNHVYANREIIKQILFQGQEAALIEVDQAHTANVAILPTKDRPQGPYDGAITQLTRVGIMMKHADCQACLLYDPEHNVIANIHSGWRGSVANIYAEAIALLGRTWQTKPEKLIACISPSLGPCHAVYENWKEIFPPHFGSFQTEENLFNFWEISRHQLQECGLNPSHIEVAKKCPYDTPELFYSYRRNEITGRNATCIALGTEPFND